MTYTMHKTSYPAKAEVKRGVAFRAQLDGSPYYWTGIPCKHGHVTWRKTSNNRCILCK